RLGTHSVGSMMARDGEEDSFPPARIIGPATVVLDVVSPHPRYLISLRLAELAGYWAGIDRAARVPSLEHVTRGCSAFRAGRESTPGGGGIPLSAMALGVGAHRCGTDCPLRRSPSHRVPQRRLPLPGAGASRTVPGIALGHGPSRQLLPSALARGLLRAAPPIDGRERAGLPRRELRPVPPCVVAARGPAARLRAALGSARGRVLLRAAPWAARDPHLGQLLAGSARPGWSARGRGALPPWAHDGGRAVLRRSRVQQGVVAPAPRGSHLVGALARRPVVAHRREARGGDGRGRGRVAGRRPAVASRTSRGGLLAQAGGDSSRRRLRPHGAESAVPRATPARARESDRAPAVVAPP